jgi:hypothetical protein
VGVHGVRVLLAVLLVEGDLTVQSLLWIGWLKGGGILQWLRTTQAWCLPHLPSPNLPALRAACCLLLFVATRVLVFTLSHAVSVVVVFPLLLLVDC